MIKLPWWVLAIVAAAAFLAGGFLGSARNAKARGRAEEAERQADVLRAKVHADSIAMEAQWAEYQAERATGVARAAALAAAELRIAAEARARRADRMALTARADSMGRLLSDTATVVPRQTYDAARGALAAAIADAEAATARLAPLAAERDAWHGLWAQADSGWTADREQVAGLNAALAAQVRATEAWRKAAKPSLGVRALHALPSLAVGAGLCWAFCPGH